MLSLRVSASAGRRCGRPADSCNGAGLVDIVPHHGPIVRTLSLAEIVDLFDVRACLGRLAGQLAASAMTRAVLADLRAQIADSTKPRAPPTPSAISRSILSSIPALYPATGNARLAALDAQMGKELRILSPSWSCLWRRACGVQCRASRRARRPSNAAIARPPARTRKTYPKRPRSLHSRDVSNAVNSSLKDGIGGKKRSKKGSTGLQ